MHSIIGLKKAGGRVIPSHHALKMEVPPRSIGKDGVRIKTIGPISCILEISKGLIAQPHAYVPNQIEIARNNLTSKQGGPVAQNAVGYRKRCVGGCENQRRTAPHDAISPHIRPTPTAVKGPLCVIRRHAILKSMRGTIDDNTIRVANKLHPAQDNIAHPAIQTGGSASQLQVFNLQIACTGEVQHISPYVPAIENGAFRTADDFDRLAGHPRIKTANSNRHIRRIITRVHVHGIASAQLITVHYRLQAAQRPR